MPLLQVETSLQLSAGKRRSLLYAAVACAAERLGIDENNVRARYVEAAEDYAIGTSPVCEPWVVVYANIKAGRSPATKRAFTAALFDRLSEELQIARSAIRILIRDYAPEDWNNGGDDTAESSAKAIPEIHCGTAS